MSSELIFVDVNVPMYAAGQAHRYKEPCIQVMRAAAQGRLLMAIDAEITQEILHRYHALQLWQVGHAMASDVLTLASVVFPITQEETRLALDLYERYAPQQVTARDLIHAAVMKVNGLTEIISVDSHFDRIEGLRRIDPLEFREPE